MNIETSSVFFVMLFIFPGAFSQVLINVFWPRYNKIQKSSMIEFAEVVSFSSFIAILNFMCISIFLYITKQNIYLVNDIISLFCKNIFIIIYSIITIIETCLVTWFIRKKGRLLSVKIVNKFNEKNGKANENGTLSLWEKIFEEYEYIDLKNNPPVISIEKDGQILSRGFLNSWPAPHTECNELILVWSAEIEEYFKSDENKPISEKIFYNIKFEYILLSEGIVIKFYNMDRYNNYCNNINETNSQ